MTIKSKIKLLSPLVAIALISSNLGLSNLGSGPAFAFRTGNVNRTNINRSNINRSNINRSNIDRSTINRNNVNRSNVDRSTINRNNINVNNVNRSNPNLRNRVTDGNPRTIQRNNIQRSNVNIDRSVNVNRWNRNNIIVNPRGVNRGTWWWNGNRAWYPAPNYWGGGFWGNLAIGVTSAAVAGAIAGSVSNANTTYTAPVIVVNSPGGQLFSSYGLVQTDCNGPVVVIYGPSDSVICAAPTATVPAGIYVIDTETLSLIPI